MSAKGAAGQSINIEKELLGDFVHVVERAAISSARTMGQGDAEAADQAAQPLRSEPVEAAVGEIGRAHV